MFKSLWNYFKGYVIIEITGFSIERFLNLCLHKSIYIYDLRETKNGVTCKVKINDFKNLRFISKKTGCKFKIISKYGFPFLVFKNRKRKLFFIGICVFIFFLYFSSSFIWSINIIGNNKVDNNQILKFCKEKNLYVGSYKKRIDPKKLQTDIKNNFDEISWVSIQIKGTLATIKVSENIIIENNTVQKEPCDIIANETGIITEIVTRSGNPLVKAKDIVEKGQTLVSGELILKEGEEVKGSYLTYSDADIKAKIEKEISVSIPFEYYVKEYTGKSKKEYELLAFNKNFYLNFIKHNISYENYDKIISRTELKLSENFSLPFIIKKIQYKEYILVKKLYSLDKAKILSDKLITEKITELIDFSSDIINKNISYNQSTDKLTATAKLTIIQNIGEKVPIKAITNIERSIVENGTNKITNTQ